MFPGLNPFEVETMPAIKVFRMAGRVLKYEPEPEDEYTQNNNKENVMQVTNKTATDNWPSGQNTFRL